MKKKLCKRLFIMFIIIAVLVTSLLLMSCKKKDKESSTTDVRVAYFPNVTHSLALIMKEQGYLEEALGDSYKVSWTAFNAGPAEVEALFAQEIDLGFIGPVPAITANVKSQGEFKIFSGSAMGAEALVIKKDSNITDIKKLIGKKIAVPQFGNTQHLALLSLLSQNNLEVGEGSSKIQIIEAENADIVNLLDRGEIDAAMVPEPWVSMIIKQSDATILIDYDGFGVDSEGDSTAVVIANEEFLKKNSEVQESFIKAQKKALDYLNTNPDEAYKIIIQQIANVTGKELDSDIVKSSFSRMKLDTNIPKNSIDNFYNASVEQGFIEKSNTSMYIE